MEWTLCQEDFEHPSILGCCINDGEPIGTVVTMSSKPPVMRLQDECAAIRFIVLTDGTTYENTCYQCEAPRLSAKEIENRLGRGSGESEDYEGRINVNLIE